MYINVRRGEEICRLGANITVGSCVREETFHAIIWNGKFSIAFGGAMGL